MSPATPTAAPAAPYYLQQATFRTFTLAQYHKMIEMGWLTDGEPYELLEGHLVHKMSRGTPHDSTIDALEGELLRLLPPGLFIRSQRAVTLTESEPEPDIAVVPGPRNRYRTSHPVAADCRLLVEVSDSSLLIDRHDKGRIYARENIPVYWVVNVVDKVIEVYAQPSGPTADPAYAHRQDYPVGAAVPVVLDGNTVGTVAVADVMG
jgi:Uma2 family endonuclease